jgi:uncharacterized protein YjiS (DUF1127 family)
MPYRAAPAPASGLAGWAAARWQAYLDRRAQRATVRILQSLDRRTLKDIGIDRSEIHSIVYGGDHRCSRYE